MSLKRSMDQDRYRQIFEEKALMSGGLRLGGSEYGAGYVRSCKKYYKEGNPQGKTVGKCEKYRKHNAWQEYINAAAALPANRNKTRQQLMHELGKNGPHFDNYLRWKEEYRMRKPKKKHAAVALPR